MIVSSVLFKKNLGFVSLVTLTALLFTQAGFAMEAEGGPNGKRVRESSEEGQPPAKRQRTQPAVRTLGDIDVLIRQAKEGNEDAQNQLIDLSYQGLYRDYITPEKIGFLAWETQIPGETIQSRCTQNDQYAYFVIYHFPNIGAHFPALVEQIRERALEQRLAAAQNNLANLYSHGRGVEQNDKKAFRFYKRAADQGLAVAQANLANLYSHGRGVEKDDKEAFRFCKQAADQGLAVAQANLANLYSHGRGVEKDDKEAFRFYKRAAKQNLAIAQYSLAIMYLCGRGVEKDEQEAFRFCKQAADQGLAVAQVDLANLYFFGQGVGKNMIEALYWSIKSKVQSQLQKKFCCASFPVDYAAPITDEPFQTLLNRIIPRKNTEIDTAFNRLLASHQVRIITNKKERGAKSAFAIPELEKIYGDIELLEVDIRSTLESLFTLRPGFMITTVKLSKEIKELLPQQITPFLLSTQLDDTTYLTLGEENVCIAKKVMELDEKFNKVDETLARVMGLYEKGTEPALSHLMVLQLLTEIPSCVDEIVDEEGKGEPVKEYFQNVSCLAHAPQAFQEQAQKLEDLKTYIQCRINEIQEERDILCKIREDVKSIIPLGVGHRNKEFWDEYSFLKG